MVEMIDKGRQKYIFFTVVKMIEKGIGSYDLWRGYKNNMVNFK